MTFDVEIDKNNSFIGLNVDCIVHLHDLLTKNAELIGADPVEPRGVKSYDALESAVGRQLTGSGNWYKYDNPLLSCATLIYGINKNHIFHNGNKRASFLAMIKHLYVNGYVLKPEIRHNDIYSLILAIADKEGSIKDYAIRYAVGNKNGKAILNRMSRKMKWSPEEEVLYISYWLKNASISKNLIPKFRMKISELKNILESKNLYLEQTNNGVIKIFRKEHQKSLFGLQTKIISVDEKTYTLGNSKLSEINKEIVDAIRQDFNLKISDGFDNVSFYDSDYFIDAQMSTYKGLIYRLSKT